jgi:hypothetical protein
MAAMTMSAMTMSSGMSGSMQPVRRAAEAAIGRPAIGLAVGAGDERISGAAILPGRQAHRYRGNRSASHQCKHHTTRTFHGCDPAPGFLASHVSFHHSRRGKQATAGAFHGIVRVFSFRRNRRRGRTSRSRRAGRHANWSQRWLKMKPRRIRSRRCCCAMIRRRSRHDWTRNCAAGIRCCCFAGATARLHPAAAGNCRAASAYRRCCRPRACPSATAQRDPSASPAGLVAAL